MKNSYGRIICDNCLGNLQTYKETPVEGPWMVKSYRYIVTCKKCREKHPEFENTSGTLDI